MKTAIILTGMLVFLTLFFAGRVAFRDEAEPILISPGYDYYEPPETEMPEEWNAPTTDQITVHVGETGAKKNGDYKPAIDVKNDTIGQDSDSEPVIHEAPESTWTCYDYSVDFAENNPDWGIVTISNHRQFYGSSHMVNYQLTDNGVLLIHDGLYSADYTYNGWQHDGKFYHFWDENQTPLRNYKVLIDNREVLEVTP